MTDDDDDQPEKPAEITPRRQADLDESARILREEVARREEWLLKKEEYLSVTIHGNKKGRKKK